MPTIAATRRGPIRDDLSPLQKMVQARAYLKNWVALGVVSRAARLTSMRWVPNPIARSINNRVVVARTRNGRQVVARWADLGAIYDVFVVNDYAYSDIDWTQLKTVVDIGANIGAFSLWAAHPTRTQVFAVEPGRGNFRILSENLRCLGERAVALEAAVAAERGEIPFYDAFHGTNSSIIGWRKGWDKRLSTYTVTAVTLRDVLDRCGFSEVDLLKMDIEGAEDEIFASLDVRTLDPVQAIIVECHPQLGTNTQRVIDILVAAGMTVAREDRASPMILGWRKR